MRRLGFFIIALLALIISYNAYAQFSAQNDAKYMATLKAVVDIKINDEENLSDVEKLRGDERFYKQLSQMLDKLSNTKTKDAENRRVLNILEKAGKDIYDELK